MAASTTLWPGVRLLEQLDSIVEGKRDGFDGFHAMEYGHHAMYERLYPDPHHNYFCDLNHNGGFLLCLHPDVKPVAVALDKPSVIKHCWFGCNGDPVTYLTAAMVAQRYDIVALKCEERFDKDDAGAKKEASASCKRPRAVDDDDSDY